MKKTMSVLLALVLLLALSVPAMAAGEGTITINNAVAGQTYTIYEILYLESYNPAEGSEAYAYKATTAWNEFINSDGIKGTYMDVDAQGYVTWKDGADAAAFAKLARAYAAEKNLANQGQKTAEKKDDSNITTVTFDKLDLGYYLVDSTLGTLCSLDTTKPNATIDEKNAEPTNVKTVEEDSTGAYGSTNDADIGQTVNFKSTITAQAGAENYVFHDKMSGGLTFGAVTGVTLKHKEDTEAATVASDNYEIKTEGLTDGCTFEIVFKQTFCDTLKANDKIEISYTATVNENAVVGLTGNDNMSKLDYGDSSNTKTTPPSKTTTYTWDMSVLKYANGNKNAPLENAKFVLLNKDKEKVAMVVGGKLTGWTAIPAAGADGAIAWPENTVLATGRDGKIVITGLDSDTYYLREVKAPDGYNKLANDVPVTITGATKGENDTLTYTTVLTEVENKSGAELPSTGGVGTTVFYVVGGLMVLLAVVLLVTRKKMSAGKD